MPRRVANAHLRALLRRAFCWDAPHRPQLHLNGAAVFARLGHVNCALRCKDALHHPQLPLDGAAVFARVSYVNCGDSLHHRSTGVREVPSHSQPIAKQCGACNPDAWICRALLGPMRGSAAPSQHLHELQLASTNPVFGHAVQGQPRPTTNPVFRHAVQGAAPPQDTSASVRKPAHRCTIAAPA